MSNDTSKRYKKGEKIILEGSPGDVIFFVQSGKFKAYLERGGKTIEIGIYGAQQVIGDQWIFSQSKSLFTFEAMQESQVLEIPVEVIKAQLEKSNPALKLIVKSMGDELKTARQAQRSKALEGDFSPMPMSQMAKSLSLIHLSARHLGVTTEAGVEIDWGLFRQSLQRFFLEPSSRLKQWMLLLKKKNYAQFEIKTSEEGEEDLGKILLTNVQILEDFAEFYQHYFFKSPTHELIQYEESPFRAAKTLVQVGEGAPVDHRKATVVEMTQINQAYKAQYGVDFKVNQFDHLERKGLFVKRQSFDDGRLTVAFDREEFLKVASFWELLKEVNLWNEKGFVDVNEKPLQPSSSASLLCPSCESELKVDHKFCPECGFKLAA